MDSEDWSELLPTFWNVTNKLDEIRNISFKDMLPEAYNLIKGAQLNGQSHPLITDWLQVRVLPRPPRFNMYTYQDIKAVHLELTERCQAACPMCPRTGNKELNNAELSLDDIKLIFPEHFVKQLTHFSLCGAIVTGKQIGRAHV